MGYTTDFTGSFKITPPLKPEHRDYINKFSETRRMKRNPRIAETLPDPVRLAAGLPIGEEAEFFVGATGNYGQGHDASVLEHNYQPDSQPGLWCQWVANDVGDQLMWDGGEKFYSYVEWLEYLLSKLLIPWGYKLNGTVEWAGEEPGDLGKIVVKDNEVTIKTGKVIYE